MNAMPQPSRLLFAAALIALGITGLVNGDFALVWQHVPAGVPGRTVLAYVCAVIELAFGIGLLWPRTLAWTRRLLFPYMVIWLVLLEIPGVIRAPLDAGAWGSIGEIAIITVGAWCLFAMGTAGIRAARWLLIVALPMIGVEVIVDTIQRGSKIMPPWLQVLPDPTAWAFLSGAASIAACLGLLFGVWPQLAATLEAAMLGVIAILFWAPYLHTGRTATTAFIISFLIAAGVWVVADTYRGLPWFATGRPVWKAPISVSDPAPTTTPHATATQGSGQ
ncbi:MAG: DoxX family protein [Rhodanobacteraceae bacterium]|nr:MAG: DoxX family protein [Rhodanobacteraceae bacterium]